MKVDMSKCQGLYCDITEERAIFYLNDIKLLEVTAALLNDAIGKGLVLHFISNGLYYDSGSSVYKPMDSDVYFACLPDSEKIIFLMDPKNFKTRE